MKLPQTLRARRPDGRDTYLIVKGFLFVLLGYAYTVANVPHNAKTTLSPVTNHIPLRVFGVLWLACGTYCIVAGLVRRRIGGFGVGVLMPTLWGTVYLISWFSGATGRGWVTTGIFWAIAAAMQCVAGLVDPQPVIERRTGE